MLLNDLTYAVRRMMAGIKASALARACSDPG
jgi:hypothetical protein